MAAEFLCRRKSCYVSVDVIDLQRSVVTGESCGRSSVHWHVAAEGLFIAVIGLIPAG